ncbi:hypothetical protein KA977_11300, partial [Candidatus Dependentiae bacterium]|nr:hypothetical protein [Candidatus Dependentiae bacterium]
MDKTVEYKNGLNKKNNADISIPHIAPLFYIVFDQSQEQVYSPFETGYSGMSQLTVSLKKIGASVSINSLPLEKFLENYSGKGKILVLGVAVNRRYRQAEITALENFIKSGGSILVIVEHEDFFGNITFQNDFIKKFGITALSLTSLAEGNNFRTQQWVFCSSKIWNSENVELYYPAPLHIDSGVRILLEMNNP